MPRSRDASCRFHGRRLREELVLMERCRDCGSLRERRGVSRWGVRTMPWAMWLIALCLLALVLG